MNEKVKHIEILLEKREDYLGGNHDYIIHSILNTIDLKDLISFYLKKEDSNLKNSIESNIHKRFEYISNPELQYENLFILLQNAEYHTRQRIKNLQFSLLKRLDNIHYKDFFDIYINSKYYYENTLALSISGKFWNKELSLLVLGKFLEKKKAPYLKTLLENNSISILIPFMKEIWSYEISNFLKMELIRKSAIEHFDSLYFLEKLEPERYLYAMSISEKKFTDNEILSISEKIPQEKKYYALMSYGRLNKWELIKPELEKYIS